MSNKMEDELRNFIPGHFFERGPYEVWASKTWNNREIVKIAGGLCIETAEAFSWPFKEIRLDGKIVE